MPFTRPVIVHGEEEQFWVPLVQETLYPVIADPLLAGVSQRRIALMLDLVTVRLVGTSGVAAGITLCEESETAESPISFLATTWKA